MNLSTKLSFKLINSHKKSPQSCSVYYFACATISMGHAHVKQCRAEDYFRLCLSTLHFYLFLPHLIHSGSPLLYLAYFIFSTPLCPCMMQVSIGSNYSDDRRGRFHSREWIKREKDKEGRKATKKAAQEKRRRKESTFVILEPFEEILLPEPLLQ